jgi:hypothetical protein
MPSSCTPYNKEARNPGELKMPSSCTPYNKEAKKPGN